MMHKTRLQQLAVILACGGLFSLSHAQEITPKTGLWQIQTELPAEQKAAMAKMHKKMTVQSREHGMNYDPESGTMTLTQCLDAAHLKQWHQFGQDPKQKCDPPKVNQQANTVIFDMTCTQPRAATMHSEIEFSPNREQYQFKHLIKYEGKEMQIKGQAKRLGDCS